MRMNFLWVVVFCSLLPTLSAQAAFTEEQLDRLMDRPQRISGHLAAATSAEALDLMVQAILKVDSLPLTQELKNQKIAIMVAEAVLVAKETTPEFISKLILKLDPKFAGVVFAAALVAAGQNSPQLLAALREALKADAVRLAAVNLAALNPPLTLGDPAMRAIGFIISMNMMPTTAWARMSAPIQPPPVLEPYRNQNRTSEPASGAAGGGGGGSGSSADCPPPPVCK